MLPFFIMLFITSSVVGQADKRKSQFNLSNNGLAIQGYDAVAYYLDHKAIKGNPALSLHFEGITYYFSSQQHKDAFRAAPSKFEPQFGGWCAYAMGSSGEKVDIDPETFKIVNGKLYLFYNRYFNNTLKTWNKDEARLLNKANENWTKTYDKN